MVKIDVEYIAHRGFVQIYYKKCGKKMAIKVKTLLHLYLFLFIFYMFNREFVLGGVLDLRFPILLLGVIILVQAVLKNKFFLKKDKNFFLINMFFLFVFFSNIMWVFNEFTLNSDAFIVIILSAVYNYMFVLVLQLKIDDIEMNKIVKYMNIAFLFLFISMLLVLLNFELGYLIGHSDFRWYASTENVNMPFGLTRRISGFAEDPNYVSFLATMIIFVNLRFKHRKMKIMIFLALIALLLSFSRTITPVLIFSILALLGEKILKAITSKQIDMITFPTFIAAISFILAPFFLLALNVYTGMSTMDLRFLMWDNAVSLFLNNPLFGSGLTSFRSYFSLQTVGWFVQSHNTFLTILSENGLIAWALFILILFNQFKFKDKYHSCLVLTFIAISFSYDITNHPYFVFISALLCYATIYCEKNCTEEEVKFNLDSRQTLELVGESEFQ